MQSTSHPCVLTLTLSEFRAQLYEEERAAATIEKYLRDAAHFLGFLSGRVTAGSKRETLSNADSYDDYVASGQAPDACLPLTITKADTIAYKEHLTRHYAVRSVNSMLSSVGRYLECAGASNLRVRHLKVQAGTFEAAHKNLELGEYHRILTVARRRSASLAMGIETLAMTGARVSELAFFTVSAVKSGRVTIRNKGKRRVILIPEKLRRKLLLFAEAQKFRDGCIFRTRTGRIKDRSNIWREMKALAGSAGVDPTKIFPHNLRHLFARLYYRKTKDLPGLADVLGHSSLNVTRIYTAETEQAILTRMNAVTSAMILPDDGGGGWGRKSSMIPAAGS